MLLAHEQSKFKHKLVVKGAFCSMDALRPGLLCGYDVQEGTIYRHCFPIFLPTPDCSGISRDLSSSSAAKSTDNDLLQASVRKLTKSMNNYVVLLFSAISCFQRCIILASLHSSTNSYMKTTTQTGERGVSSIPARFFAVCQRNLR